MGYCPFSLSIHAMRKSTMPRCRPAIVVTRAQIVYLVPLYIWYGANRRLAK